MQFLIHAHDAGFQSKPPSRARDRGPFIVHAAREGGPLDDRAGCYAARSVRRPADNRDK
jgi:hypothetical protein